MLDQVNATQRPTWNKGKLIGTKLQIEGRAHDLAMFNLAIDNKLRGCNPAHERPLCARSGRSRNERCAMTIKPLRREELGRRAFSRRPV
jgi:hypothetical protein